MIKLNGSQKLLLAVASSSEFEAVLKGLDIKGKSVPPVWKSLDLEQLKILHTGVGKTNAAGAVSRELTLAESEAEMYSAVISIGLGGCYEKDFKLGQSVLGADHILLDEGTISNAGWVTLEKSGWSRTVIKANKGPLFTQMNELVDHVGNIGTVSTISGTNTKMGEYKKRFEVLLEVMESASIAEVCDKFEIEYVDLRVISNFCGERTEDSHNFPLALKSLSELTNRVFGTTH